MTSIGRCWIGIIMRGPLGTWWTAPAGDGEDTPAGLGDTTQHGHCALFSAAAQWGVDAVGN